MSPHSSRSVRFAMPRDKHKPDARVGGTSAAINGWCARLAAPAGVSQGAEDAEILAACPSDAPRLGRRAGSSCSGNTPGQHQAASVR